MKHDPKILLYPHLHDRDDLDPSIIQHNDINRRSFLSTLPTTLATITATISSIAPRNNNDIANAAQTPPPSSSFQLENGLLESRVVENFLSAPTYGMESPDVFYPT